MKSQCLNVIEIVLAQNVSLVLIAGASMVAALAANIQNRELSLLTRIVSETKSDSSRGRGDGG
jgi:hypothetical protein